MKHTFACGITATSNDGAGDLFLAGLMRREASDESAERALRDRIASLEGRLRDAEMMLTAIVLAGGPEKRVDDYHLIRAYDCELIHYRDESRHETVFRVHKRA